MKLKPMVRIALFAALGIALVAAGAVGMRVVEGMTEQAASSLYLQAAETGLKGGDKPRALFFAGSAAAASRSAFVLVSAADIAFRADNRKLADDLLAEAEPLAHDADALMMQRLKERMSASAK